MKWEIEITLVILIFFRKKFLETARRAFQDVLSRNKSKKIEITKVISISQISPQNELVKMYCTVEKIRKKIAHVFK